MSPRLALAAAAALVLAACTRPALAVVGGSEAPSPLAARTVMVLTSRGGVCTGIVVAPDAVLTAGHCAAGGIGLRVHWMEGGAPVLVEPASIAVHPGYDPGAIKARRRSTDLALVRLRSPLPGRFVPAALSAGPTAKGAPVAIGGYGVAREGDERSLGTFRTAILQAVEPYGPSRILLWLRDPAGRAGPCTGDSGGPAADGAGAVVAVTTWASGPGDSDCGGLSQAVLVGPERNWIDRTLGAWSIQAQWR